MTLDALWSRLGIDKLLRGLLAGTRRDASVERVLFAFVANVPWPRPPRSPPRPGSTTT